MPVDKTQLFSLLAVIDRDENNPKHKHEGNRRLFLEESHGFGRHTYRAVLESTELRDWEVAVLGRWHQNGAHPAYHFKNPGKWWGVGR